MGMMHSKRLSKEDLVFLTKHTHFTEKQIKTWYHGFMKDCPQGLLTKAKLMEVYADLFQQGNPESFCNHVFRTFDHDNSGKIDFKEFMLAISVTSAEDPKEKLTWAFTMYDKNKDGTIEKSEMVDIITAIFSLMGCENKSPKTQTELAFSKLDLNKDGIITFEEFLKGCLENPTIENVLTYKSDMAGNVPFFIPLREGIILTCSTPYLPTISLIGAIYEMLGCEDTQEAPEDRTEKIFHKMDTNNDGVLSREEFITGCMDDEDLRQLLTVDAICGVH